MTGLYWTPPEPDGRGREDEWREAMGDVARYAQSPPGCDSLQGMAMEIDNALDNFGEERFDDPGGQASIREGVVVYELVWRWSGTGRPAIWDIQRDFLHVLNEFSDDYICIRRTVEDGGRAVVFNVLTGSSRDSHALQFRISGTEVERAVNQA